MSLFTWSKNLPWTYFFLKSLPIYPPFTIKLEVQPSAPHVLLSLDLQRPSTFISRIHIVNITKYLPTDRVFLENKSWNLTSFPELFPSLNWNLILLSSIYSVISPLQRIPRSYWSVSRLNGSSCSPLTHLFNCSHFFYCYLCWKWPASCLDSISVLSSLLANLHTPKTKYFSGQHLCPSKYKNHSSSSLQS